MSDPGTAFAVIVSGIAGLLGLIAVLPPVAHTLRVPYSVILALVGIALGTLLTLDLPKLFLLSDVLTAIDNIELPSSAFIVVFLPLLLFETALSLDLRDLFDDIGPILLMAVIAVLVTTGVAGFAVWGVSELSLIAGLLLAAIVATTDPVAVIGIFREVGAPRRLQTLVEGESLLNDAAAIVLYTVLLGILTGTAEADAFSATQMFLQSFFGGAAFGWFGGKLGGMLCERLGTIRSALITASLSGPYIIYIFAEDYLGLSGVVAVVVAGLAFGAHMRLRGTPGQWRDLTSFWHHLAFLASSFVFLLASMLVPQAVLNLGTAHIGIVLALIVGCLLARALVLYGFVPLLTRVKLGQSIASSYKLVMLWGGLRGAVTLALALAVGEDPRVPGPVADAISGSATLFVLFTLLVQATSLRALILRLGIDRLSATEEAVRHRALDLAIHQIEERIDQSAEAFAIDRQAGEPIKERYRDMLAEIDGSWPQESQNQQFDAAYVTLAARELSINQRYYAETVVVRPVGMAAIRRATLLLDIARTDGASGYQRAVAREYRPDWRMQTGLWLYQRVGYDAELAKNLSLRFASLVLQARVLSELQQFNHTALRPLFRASVEEHVAHTLAERVRRCEEALEALRLQYPGYRTQLERRYLARSALRHEEIIYEQLYDQALIGAPVYRRLLDDLTERRRDLLQRLPLDLLPDLSSMVRRVPLFERLDDAALNTLVRIMRPRFIGPDERVVKKGERGEAMYFIVSGALEVVRRPEPIRLGSGEFFGEMALIRDGRRIADVRSLTFGQLLQLRKSDFNQFVERYPAIRDAIKRVAAQRLAESSETGRPGR